MLDWKDFIVEFTSVKEGEIKLCTSVTRVIVIILLYYFISVPSLQPAVKKKHAHVLTFRKTASCKSVRNDIKGLTFEVCYVWDILFSTNVLKILVDPRLTEMKHHRHHHKAEQREQRQLSYSLSSSFEVTTDH